jgi:hypothetical protein
VFPSILTLVTTAMIRARKLRYQQTRARTGSASNREQFLPDRDLPCRQSTYIK